MEPVIDTIAAAETKRRSARRLPNEFSILLVLVGIALLFEALGWGLRGQSFLGNQQRLLIMILQVSVVGLIAIGVTQVIITGGIDLSSGSVLAVSAMVASSLAQDPDYARAVFPALTGLPFVVPVLCGLVIGGIAGLINGSLIAITAIPPFIATLGMMVTARSVAQVYTRGQPISMLSENYTWIGSGAVPVVIFLVTAVIFHVALALHPLREVHLRDRRQPAGRAGQRHQREAPHHAGLHAGRAAVGPCRARHLGSGPERPVEHGRRLRTRCHRGRGHRRCQPRGWGRAASPAR